MNRHHLWRIIILFSFLLTLAQVPLGKGESETVPLCCGKTCEPERTDILGMLGITDSLMKAGETGKFLQRDTIISVSCGFEGITLRQLILLMDPLANGRWLLTENTAVKDNRTLGFGYDSQTKYLRLNLAEESGKPVWPDVLAPVLSAKVPAFPLGTYVSSEPVTLENRVDTVKLVYEDVSPSDVSAYGKILTEAGWSSKATSDGTVLFKNGTAFVTFLYIPATRQAEITVGSFLVHFVPLPPWPDTLPETIRRILPPVSAVRGAKAMDGGYLCKAEGLTLSELYSFVQSSMRYYNWLMLSDDSIMTHVESSISLEIMSYSTQTDTLIFFLYCENADLSTPAPTEKSLPTPTIPPDVGSFDDGLTDYNFALTRGVYNEKEALEGLRNEFGQAAEMADWSEIKVLYQERINWFLSYLGVRENEDIWIRYNGQESSNKRHYFLARIASVPRQGFLKHDQVGNEAWLGSWYGISLRVIAKVPAKN
jgi:hypothetical protein